VVTRSDASFALPATVGPPALGEGRTPDDGVSFSGHERDVLFLNLGGGRFKDVSGVSGADNPGDGRVFALLDFDRDGWWDIAEINANAPSLVLYRNRFGANDAWRASHGVIALRFVGANGEAKPTRGASNRDGFGALVTVHLGDRSLVREHRAGEGFAAQNSSTMLIGVGDARAAGTITVRWPSGKVQKLDDVPVNRLVTVREPGGAGAEPLVEVAEYAPATAIASGAALSTPPASSPARLTIAAPADAGDPELRVFTTFASWCAACRSDIPQFQRLRDAFPADRLGLFGVPADEDDDRAKIQEWVTTQRPPYTMLLDLPPSDLAAVKRLLMKRLRREALPSSIVVNRKGEVLTAMLGVPTVSDLRGLAAASRLASR